MDSKSDGSVGTPCARIGFTLLRRGRYGAPAARRHEADFSPITEKSKSFSKNEKELQGQKLVHRVFENL